MRQPQEDTPLPNNASKIDGINTVMTNDDSSFNTTVIQEEVTSDGPVSTTTTTTTLHSNSEFPIEDSSRGILGLINPTAILEPTTNPSSTIASSIGSTEDFRHFIDEEFSNEGPQAAPEIKTDEQVHFN